MSILITLRELLISILLWPPFNVIIGLFFATIGARLPDIDLAPVLPIRHRSAWTHGPVLPLVLAWAGGQWPHWNVVLVGLQAGICVHLLWDAFPRSWHGSALINLAPLRGSLSAPLSFLLIGGSAALSGWLAIQMLGGIGSLLSVIPIRF